MTVRTLTTKHVDVVFGRGRKRTDYMGRHGGGWQWALGFESTDWRRDHGITIILYVLVTSIRITIKGRKNR